jgi:peptidoglycan hydrolase CwlO-like protein
MIPLDEQSYYELLNLSSQLTQTVNALKRTIRDTPNNADSIQFRIQHLESKIEDLENKLHGLNPS